MPSVWKSICRPFAAFRSARGGNVAVMFALATIPIIAAVGFSVDFTRANAVKTAMQNALDSTALMLSRNASSLSQDDLQTQANAYFKALFNRPEAANIVITASYTTDGGTSLTVNGSADVPTTFLNVLGYKEMTVDGSSTTQVGLLAATRRAGARQHRLDERRRQDRRAQDRDEKSADPIAERRQHARGCLCVDHSVRQGCERRRRRLQFILGQLDPVG